MGVQAVASTTGKLSSGLLGKIFRVKFAYLFIIILFIQSIAVGISSGSGLLGIINSLGERFFNVTQSLQSTSLKVIEGGAVFSGFFSFFGIVWSLFSNSYLIYLWIKLFSRIWGRYNDSQKLLNNILGIITFFVLQIFYLLIFVSPLEGQTNLDLFLTPFVSLWDFFKAVILIFGSTSFGDMINSNVNPCTNPSGCII